MPHKKLFMKRNFASIASCIAAVVLAACNNSSDSTNASDTSTANGADTMNSAQTPAMNSSVPLSKADSTFIMEAAMGGLMEVQAGQIAQQNAMNQRVKDFGAMMVTDHSKANDELKSLMSGRGLVISDSLPADKKKEIDAMNKLKGKAFDQHYVNMMVEDHEKDVAEFKKQSTSAEDAQLRNWVANTLPVLQKHLDSIQAIKKSKM
jgi:putative membrane protein